MTVATLVRDIREIYLQYPKIAGYIGETPTHGRARPSAEQPLPTGRIPGGSLVVGSGPTIRIREPAPVATASLNPARAVSIDSRSRWRSSTPVGATSINRRSVPMCRRPAQSEPLDHGFLPRIESGAGSRIGVRDMPSKE